MDPNPVTRPMGGQANISICPSPNLNENKLIKTLNNQRDIDLADRITISKGKALNICFILYHTQFR